MSGQHTGNALTVRPEYCISDDDASQSMAHARPGTEDTGIALQSLRCCLSVSCNALLGLTSNYQQGSSKQPAQVGKAVHVILNEGVAARSVAGRTSCATCYSVEAPKATKSLSQVPAGGIRFAAYRFAAYRFAAYRFATYRFAAYRFAAYRFAAYCYAAYCFAASLG